MFESSVWISINLKNNAIDWKLWFQCINFIKLPVWKQGEVLLEFK
jgi:hypothetical protein